MSLALLFSVALLGSTPADHHPIKIADLNLATAEGAAIFEQRIVSLSLSLCGGYRGLERRRCETRVRADAQGQVTQKAAADAR